MPTRPARPRCRDLGIRIGLLEPGALNAITDVPGVRVGHTTLISGAGPLVPGQGPVRTGVTAILPHSGDLFLEKVVAAIDTINGFGEVTNIPQVDELGVLEGPILLTNTLNVALVADAAIEWSLTRHPEMGVTTWGLSPIVAECSDAYLNDIRGRHVRRELAAGMGVANHSYSHPYRPPFDRQPHEKILGDIGRGYDLTKDWFVEERLMIGARTVGAASRALDLSLDFAKRRVQFEEPIIDFQSIEFMLADMAAEIMAAKSLLYRVGWQASQPETDRKQVHAMASAVKLVCSETAGRVTDKAVQIFGGRGYMREQPVERLWREIRVDRIWEGTSEIQRLVIGNELRKRGAGVYSGWPAE